MWLLMVCGLFGSCLTSAATAPRTRCDISMTTWCITTFDGRITMHQDHADRVWSLKARDSGDEPPMRITETIGCSDLAEENIHLISDAEELSVAGQAVQRTEFGLNANGCKLVFDVPVGPGYRSYRQFMLYGILVGYE